MHKGNTPLVHEIIKIKKKTSALHFLAPEHAGTSGQQTLRNHMGTLEVLTSLKLTTKLLRLLVNVACIPPGTTCLMVPRKFWASRLMGRLAWLGRAVIVPDEASCYRTASQLRHSTRRPLYGSHPEQYTPNMLFYSGIGALQIFHSCVSCVQQQTKKTFHESKF